MLKGEGENLGGNIRMRQPNAELKNAFVRWPNT
jgi:hypothetical protein